MPYGLAKFVRFAENVWDVDAAGKTDGQIAEEGLAAMEDWMKELGLVMNITELGSNEEMLEGLAESTTTEYDIARAREIAATTAIVTADLILRCSSFN